MEENINDLVIGSIDVLRGLMVCMIEIGTVTHQSAINIIDTIIKIQHDRDGGNNPARHIPAEVLRETVKALLRGEDAQTSSRSSLRLIIGGKSEED